MFTLSRLRLAALAAIVAGAFGATSAASAQTDSVPPCPDKFDCSTVTVPLDRAAPAAGTIGLRVARLQGSGGAGKPALIVLAGGPGQAGVAAAAQVGLLPDPVLERYQVVLIDQRGTGASGAIECPELQSLDDVGKFRQAATQCAQRLGSRADDYTTAASVADVEAVRQAVGAPRVAVMGTSYGTYVAQRYLATYPQRVDRLILNSTMPAQLDPFQRSSLAAVDRVLNNLRRRADRDLAKLIQRLQRKPLLGAIYDGRGRRVRQQITSTTDLFEFVESGDTNPGLLAQLPAALRAAVRGDRSPLLRLHATQNAGEAAPAAEDSTGLLVATTCTDYPMPWAHGAPQAGREGALRAAADALDPASLGPFDRATARDASVANYCVGWPSATPPPVTAPPNYAAVPTLILVGEDDMRTPLEDAEAVARLIPGAEVVSVEGTGHDVVDSDQTGCAVSALASFLSGEPVGDPCRGETNEMPVLAEYPERLAEVKRNYGLRGRTGRAVTAVLDTLADAQQGVLAAAGAGQPSAIRFGGLHGGYARARRVRGDEAVIYNTRLRRYEFVPKLRITGKVNARKQTTSVRVSGAARGTVRFKGRRVTAEIDGRRLSTKIKKPSS